MPPSFPSQKGRERVKKLGPLGRAGISSKYCQCGHLVEGEGNSALQAPTVIEIFHRE